MEKWSTTNLVPLDRWSLEYSICPGRQAVGIPKYGIKLIGDYWSKAKFVYVSILVFLTFFTAPHARPRALPARAPRQCKKN